MQISLKTLKLKKLVTIYFVKILKPSPINYTNQVNICPIFLFSKLNYTKWQKKERLIFFDLLKMSSNDILKTFLTIIIIVKGKLS